MTKIEWTDRSDWNPIRGCTRVSEGCRNCYAEAIAARFSDPGKPFHGFAERTPGGPRWTGKVELIEKHLTLPLRWKRPRRIFVNSMGDLFHESVPDAWIDRVFAVMALAPQHTFQVLTKRSERMREYVASVLAGDRGISRSAHQIRFGDGPAPHVDLIDYSRPLPNVHLGVSVEDQTRADARIPDLLATPAAVRFVSAEPLLGPIDFFKIRETTGFTFNALSRKVGISFHGVGLDQIITGGESGPRARSVSRAAFLAIRDQCAAAGAAYFHKQNGEWIDADEWLDILNRNCGANLYEADLKTPWSPPRPLNFANAQILATAMGRRFEHQSDGSTLLRVGKRRAGRLLDGIEHNAFPIA